MAVSIGSSGFANIRAYQNPERSASDNGRALVVLKLGRAMRYQATAGIR
jgi:hypothetical protein